MAEYLVVPSIILKIQKESPCTTCLCHAKWRIDGLEKETLAWGDGNGECHRDNQKHWSQLGEWRLTGGGRVSFWSRCKRLQSSLDEARRSEIDNGIYRSSLCSVTLYKILPSLETMTCRGASFSLGLGVFESKVSLPEFGFTS